MEKLETVDHENVGCHVEIDKMACRVMRDRRVKIFLMEMTPLSCN